MTLNIRSAYSKKPRVMLDFTDAISRTKQSFKDECDINNIMEKYQKTGAINHANTRFAEYGFASSIELQESLNIVQTAQAMFDELPSSIRKEFDHNPAEFLDFVQNPENASKMADMGLTEQDPTEAQTQGEKAATELVDALTPEKAAE